MEILLLIGLITVFPFNLTKQIEPVISGLFGQYSSYVYNIDINYLHPYVSILDIGVIVGVAMLGYKFWQFIKTKEIRERFNEMLIPLIITFYGNIHILMHWNSLVFANTARFCLYLIFGYLVLRSLNEKLIEISEKGSQILIGIITISLIIQAVIGTIQMQNGASIGLKLLGESQVVSGISGASIRTSDGFQILRAYGTFPHPNVLAGYAIFSVMLCAFILVKFGKIDTFRKLYYLIPVIIIAIYLIIITYTQSAQLTFIIAVIVVIVWSIIKSFVVNYMKSSLKTQNFIIFITAIGIVTTLILSFFIFNNRVGIIEQIAKVPDLKIRAVLMFQGLDAIKENVLIGTGIGNYISAIKIQDAYEVFGVRLAGYIPIVDLLQPIHNIYLMFIVENGLLGLSVVISLISFYFMKFMNRTLSNSLNIYESTLIFFMKSLGIFMLLIIGSLDHYLISLPQGILMLVGILVTLLSSYDAIIPKAEVDLIKSLRKEIKG